MFDVQIVNLDAGYLCITSKKALCKGREGEKGKIYSGLIGV